MIDLLALGLGTALMLAQAGEGGQQADESVVVTGQRLDEMVHGFVESLTVEPGRENQVARFDQRVCPGIVGLRAAQAQAIADRIAIRALGAGLEVDGPGCRANILVLVATDSDRLAQEIVQRHPNLVARYSEAGVNTRGRAALSDFVSAPRAVRWWHVSTTMSADGIPTSAAAGAAGVGSRSPVDSGVRAPGAASRINRVTRQDLARALIIVDANRVGDTPVGVLGDYVAMVALAQIDPDAETTGYPTILNLFASRGAGRAAPAGLTDWDVAYLEGLYAAPRAQSAGAQGRAIERTIRDGESR